MEQSKWERFKFWVCDTFGHLGLDGKPWQYRGYKNETCKFCGRIHKEKVKK